MTAERPEPPNEVESTEREFDLQPHPRILMMLGEIDLAQWKCVAELVDNAIDGFLRAEERGEGIENPEIHIQLPTRGGPSSRLSVRDNGPGMDPDTLENAVRAGWTSNDPMGSLGLFGMGFNIATGRLGLATTVWSSKPGEDVRHGVEIKFDELTAQGHFRTPMLVSNKPDPMASGTEVAVERLKPDQQEWFSKSGNRSQLRRNLEHVYSAILGEGGRPLGLKLFVNNRVLAARRPCVWGDDLSEPRSVSHRRYGDIPAFHEINAALPSRPFCFGCWYWLPPRESVCPSCGVGDQVVERERRISGWLGIQRYVHETDFGIDFIRHGRKIERANKDLFDWQDNDAIEREYPIDDPRHRGRVVGEIHLDHCRVTYTKDRFDRNDPAWADMSRVVRGDGPLRPERAAQGGYPPNQSPLFRLFQAFRRHNPKTKVAGGYRNLLAVPDNDLAIEMAKRFNQGDPDYQSDAKWYELIEEAERASLVGGGGAGSGDDDDFWEDGEGDEHEPNGEETQDEVGESEPAKRAPIPSLTREFVDDLTGQRFPVSAFTAQLGDVDLGPGDAAWRLTRDTTGEYVFLVRPDHRVFSSVTLTPLDALLAELAWSSTDFMRGQGDDVTFAEIICAFRLRYGAAAELDPTNLSAEAVSVLRGLAAAPVGQVAPEDARILFDDLPQHARRQVLDRLASASDGTGTDAIEAGRFLEFAPLREVAQFVEDHPEFYFDGNHWDLAYEEIDLGDAEATDAARARIVRRQVSLILDTVWLAEQNPTEMLAAGRARVMRAALALDLLREDTVEGDE